jgi:hypothetical protein
METTAEIAIKRHGEYLAMHDVLLKEILTHLIEKSPRLLAEISQSVAYQHAAIEGISTEDFQIRNADVQRRLDALLHAVKEGR